MKKYIIVLNIFALLIACQSDDTYENLNEDPKNPTEVSPEFLFTSATVSLFDQMINLNVNTNIFRLLAQYLTPTTYTDEANYNLNNRNIPDNHWSELFRDVLFDLKDAKRYLNDDETISSSDRDIKLGQIEVLEVITWQILVDTFGNIPYSEALSPDETLLPEYDEASSIYDDLLARIDNAITNLEGNGEGFTEADVIYKGDLSLWQKFANSAKLRLAMRIADVNPSKSQTATEEAFNAGVFESQNDGAIIEYQSSPPNTNPLWVDLVQSGRSDFVIANTLVDIMNELEDPRREYYFDENLEEGYKGGVYGVNNSYPSFTHIGDPFLDPELPGILMDYVEVKFYLAEAAQRGYNVGQTAEDHYNEAVKASVLYYEGTEAEYQTYIAQPEVAYDATNWREQLGTQFWIAMFDNGFQGWSGWRKYDSPQLNIPTTSGSPVPLRYTYPIDEQNLNTTNYEAASSAIGGDQQQTALFWDIN